MEESRRSNGSIRTTVVPVPEAQNMVVLSKQLLILVFSKALKC